MVFGATAMAQNNPTVSIVTEYLMTMDFPFESLACLLPGESSIYRQVGQTMDRRSMEL